MGFGTPTVNRPSGAILPNAAAPSIGNSESADETYARQLADTARRSAIRLHAYYRAERRGFAPGHELEDWLAAERQMSEIDAIREQQSR